MPCARDACRLALRSARAYLPSHADLPRDPPRPGDDLRRRLAGARHRRLPPVAPRRHRRGRRAAEGNAAQAEPHDDAADPVPGRGDRDRVRTELSQRRLERLPAAADRRRGGAALVRLLRAGHPDVRGRRTRTRGPVGSDGLGCVLSATPRRALAGRPGG